MSIERLRAIMAALRDPRARLSVGPRADLGQHRAAHDRGSLRTGRCHRARRRAKPCATSSATCCSRSCSSRASPRSRGCSTSTRVAAAISDKLERRHPHVFGDAAIGHGRRADRRLGAAQGRGAARAPAAAAGCSTASRSACPHSRALPSSAGARPRVRLRLGADAEDVLGKVEEECASCGRRSRRGDTRPVARGTRRPAVQRRAVGAARRQSTRRRRCGPPTPSSSDASGAWRPGSPSRARTPRDADPTNWRRLWARAKQELG